MQNRIAAFAHRVIDQAVIDTDGIAVPVDISRNTFRVDMLAVGKVKTAVIVLGVISAMLSGTSVVSC